MMMKTILLVLGAVLLVGCNNPTAPAPVVQLKPVPARVFLIPLDSARL